MPKAQRVQTIPERAIDLVNTLEAEGIDIADHELARSIIETSLKEAARDGIQLFGCRGGFGHKALGALPDGPLSERAP